MAAEKKRKQPGADVLNSVSRFGLKLTNALIAAGSGNVMGAVTGVIGLGSGMRVTSVASSPSGRLGAASRPR